MIKLLEFEEMELRHKEGEDPFELAVEKWIRIRDFLLEKADFVRYKEAYECGSSKILFCLDYKNHCPLCPLECVCFDSQSLYYQIMRYLQVYALVGTLLPQQPLITLIESYIRDLDKYRKEWLKKGH